MIIVTDMVTDVLVINRIDEDLAIGDVLVMNIKGNFWLWIIAFQPRV